MTNLTINSTDFNAFDRIQQANTAVLKAVNNELVELLLADREKHCWKQDQFDWGQYVQDGSYVLKDD